MNELQTFTYNNSQVRTVEMNGEPWFVLKDVCDVLGIVNTSDVYKRLDEDERGRFNLGRQGEANIISESGLYNVILRSDKPEAKPFRKWVTAEVLPSIRKTGSYSTPLKPNKALEIKEINAKVRLSNQFLKLSKVDTLSAEYKNILAAKAAEVLTGAQLIPLPQSEQKMYSATEIGRCSGFPLRRLGASPTSTISRPPNTVSGIARSRSIPTKRSIPLFTMTRRWKSLGRFSLNPLTTAPNRGIMNITE